MFNFFWKKYTLQKKVYRTNFLQFWILYSDILFLAKIPYFNYQINFQSSHLTKKEAEDASKRLSSYCMGALNWDSNRFAESLFASQSFISHPSVRENNALSPVLFLCFAFPARSPHFPHYLQFFRVNFSFVASFSKQMGSFSLCTM